MFSNRLLLIFGRFAVFVVFLIVPAWLFASSFVVSTVPIKGIMPWMVTALTEPSGDNIYPLAPGAGAQYTLALFDTGSTTVAISSGIAGSWSLASETSVNVRINGLGAGTESGGYPIGAQGTAGQAQAEVGDIKVKVCTMGQHARNPFLTPQFRHRMPSNSINWQIQSLKFT